VFSQVYHRHRHQLAVGGTGAVRAGMNRFNFALIVGLTMVVSKFNGGLSLVDFTLIQA
jgi:hypothetical protein